ncbi:MAG: hypothetical protein Q7J43_10730 [Pseudomonas sp.]|uniref:DUF6776 family protein n=1 Tax=Pseudomonas sp. TaxID=306 RepID=UPI0027262595|nr:DUF6776 family protein [Pseudomonas sp.]MDO9618142.1 hypothetical protein [Pseudomonas sp.]MDP2447046.1 hypothetical protein [Pseudomonas sp.]MDZ4334563.1 DUF6776 family protein [Pseudomonas sp.]
MLGLLLVLCIPLAFYAGGWWLQYSQPAVVVGQPAEPVRDEQLLREVDELRQRLVVLGSAEKVSLQANEQSRLTIKLLEEQIYKQQQDLAFYKGVLAPASRREGLRIKTFELQATDRPEHFRYKILLSRVGKGDTPLEGQLQVSIVGKQDGQDVTLELAALSAGLPDGLPEQSITFAFKHFQAIPEAGRFAELKVPEGFIPREIKVRAEVKGEKPLLRTFKWNKEE